jgi:adenylate cyclase
MATRSKLAVILHADVVGSTAFVQKDERLAHDRIQDVFRRFSETTTVYGGATHELRGDALLAEFNRASDAVSAALAFQAKNAEHNIALDDEIRPVVRVGISLGEVVIADGTLTGPDVVLAQRLEQLAPPGGVCVSQSVFQSTPRRLPFDYSDLGEQDVKGFAEPARAYVIELRKGENVPEPEPISSKLSVGTSNARSKSRRALVAVVGVLVAIAGGFILWQQWKPEFEPAVIERMAYPLPDNPSIAVLPFDNLSGDSRQDHVADGLTESLIAALSKVPDLFIIAQNSTFTYKGKSVKVQQVAEDLGVRYILEGSIQRTGEKVRVTTQLVDAISGNHIWAERYDRKFADLFELQDDVVKNVLVELQVKLTEGDNAKLASRQTASLDAWLLRNQAYAEGFKFTREGFIRSRKLYEAAHEADPKWSRPLAGIAWTHEWEARRGWSKSKEESIRIGMELAQKAIDMEPTDPLGYQILGNLYFAKGDYTQAIALREKALELAPNSFNVIVGLASLLRRGGEAERALELLERAKRFSPKHPWWVPYTEGVTLLLVGEHERAITALNEAISRKPKRADTHVQLAAVLVDMGRLEEAKKAISDALKLDPKMSVSRMTRISEFQDPKTASWHDDLLRTAGLPE